jgi:hypothetical protein
MVTVPSAPAGGTAPGEYPALEPAKRSPFRCGRGTYAIGSTAVPNSSKRLTSRAGPTGTAEDAAPSAVLALRLAARAARTLVLRPLSSHRMKLANQICP